MAGTYMTASDAKDWISEQNKTKEGYKMWRQLYGATDLAAQRDLSSLRYSTEEALGEAYAQAFAAKEAVENSNYFDSYKLTAEQDINKTLEEAYNSYINNYMTAANEIEKGAAENRELITQSLEKESQRYTDVYNSLYDYLADLYDKTYYTAETPADFWTNAGRNWSKYLVTDVDGSQRLISREELAQGIKDDEGNYLFDPMFESKNGVSTLTVAGEDFIDQMLNEMSLEGDAIAYEDWLKDNNPELYNWYTGYNPYTYAPKNDMSDYTTGASSFRQFVGLKSTDQKYSFIERFGGLNRNQLDDKIDDITRNIVNATKISDEKKSIKSMKDSINDVTGILKSLGLEEEFEEELRDSGYTIDTLSEKLDEYASGIISDSDMTANWFADFGLSTAASGVAGAGLGSTAFPVVGTVLGGLIGLAAGAAGGIVGGSIGVADDKRANKRAKEKSKKLVLDLVYNLAAYAENKYNTVRSN